jgi:CO/xanthine dehydrogenase FAD-binding subunit
MWDSGTGRATRQACAANVSSATITGDSARRTTRRRKLLASGQSLLPMLNLRLPRPATVIAIGRSLDGDNHSEGSELVVPAGTTHVSLIASEHVIGSG